MKISQLMSVLAERQAKHGDVDVEASWEGQFHSINEANIYLGKAGVLLIDADDNQDKVRNAADPLEGEESLGLR